jgi:hypothetical protein
MSNELDYNIKHFNEMFIDNLSQSLSSILVAKKANPAGVEEVKDSADVEMKPEDQPM